MDPLCNPGSLIAQAVCCFLDLLHHNAVMKETVSNNALIRMSGKSIYA
jgi:hypothetical protein